jgi:predicted glycogen debranching enzyme
MDLSFGKSELDAESGSAREWLLTNGLGGFASSTVIGLNTRRYHGLLVASLKPPVYRRLLVAKLDEEIAIGDCQYVLGTNQVHDGYYAQEGYRLLQRFERQPFPKYTYQVGDVFVIKKIFMVYGRNATVIRYRIFNENRRPVTLRIRPLVNCRDFHGSIFRNDWPFTQEMRGNQAEIEPFPGAPHIYLASDRAGYHIQPDWYLGMYYGMERRRGLPCNEDHFMPGYFLVDSDESIDFTIVASAGPIPSVSPERLEAEALERRRRLLAAAGLGAAVESPTCADAETAAGWQDDLIRQLVLAADDFLVHRESTGKRTIIAGYPWFTDWGRDAMIALPGLTLCTGRSKEAKEILATFAAYVRDGLIPNMFQDSGQAPLYNTIDASLWFFYTVQKLLQYTSDYDFVLERLYPVMQGIIDHYRRGTRFRIRMAEDGLVEGGEAGLQLTWMDAKADDWVVTPRIGKPVEVNALWYNALMFMSELSAVLQKRGGKKVPGPEWEREPERVQERERERERERQAGQGQEPQTEPERERQAERMREEEPEQEREPEREGEQERDQDGAPKQGQEQKREWERGHEQEREPEYEPDLYGRLASRVRASFRAVFWNEAGQCLYDVVAGESRDASIRPNQIFAVSLPYSPLTRAQARAVVRKVWQMLYTPYGLRSLSPSDPAYRGRYLGNQWERDAAYHQGTVWSWLIGHFISAYRRVSGDSGASAEIAALMLAPFRDHLRDHGVGSVSEVCDGDQPFTPRGCFAQAWGVGEVLRCLIEELHGK